MNKIVTGIIGAIGLILIVAGSVFLGIFPGVLRRTIREKLPLDDNSTASFDRWINFKAPLTMSFNFFNLNKSNFQSLEELEFEHQGPYVYDEIRKKKDVQYSENKTELSYRDYKEYIFNSEKSDHRSEEDIIEFINFPTLGAIDNAVFKTLGKQIYDGLKKQGSIPIDERNLFIKSSVVDLIFNGMKLKLFESPFLRAVTKYPWFSIMDTHNVTEEEWVINTGKDDVDELGQLIKFDGKDELRNKFNDLIWKDDSCKCNHLNGTDGTFFKPNIQKDDVLYAFEPQVCRTVFLHYWKETEVRDIPTYRFVVPQEYFNNPKYTPTNECYFYDEGARFDSGLLNISLCDRRSLGAKIFMSEPFFNHADQRLRTQFKTELKPEKELNDDNYGTYLDIEPNTGIVLRAVRRLQMNIGVDGTNELYQSPKNDTKQYIVPVFWIEEVGEATDEQADELKSMLLNVKKIGNGVSIGVIVVGVIMIAVSVFFCIRR